MKRGVYTHQGASLACQKGIYPPGCLSSIPEEDYTHQGASLACQKVYYAHHATRVVYQAGICPPCYPGGVSGCVYASLCGYLPWWVSLIGYPSQVGISHRGIPLRCTSRVCTSRECTSVTVLLGEYGHNEAQRGPSSPLG